jgi:hypothetical protein
MISSPESEGTMPDKNDPESYVTMREPFGRWLIAQKDRGDWVDDLANAARADRTFPKDGDPEAVRAHLRAQQADGDTFQAVDDAEGHWQSSGGHRGRDFVDNGDQAG